MNNINEPVNLRIGDRIGDLRNRIAKNKENKAKLGEATPPSEKSRIAKLREEYLKPLSSGRIDEKKLFWMEFFEKNPIRISSENRPTSWLNHDIPNLSTVNLVNDVRKGNTEGLGLKFRTQGSLSEIREEQQTRKFDPLAIEMAKRRMQNPEY